MNTQLKKLDSVEKGMIEKSYDELIELAIHLNHFRYDVTAKRTLQLIEQKILIDISDLETIQKNKDTDDTSEVLVYDKRWVNLLSLYRIISMCIVSNKPNDIKNWLKNIPK